MKKNWKIEKGESLEEKTRWGGSYFGICEIHPHQQFLTHGKICVYFHTAPSTHWTCQHQPGAVTRGSKEHVVPAYCKCPGQPNLKNIRAYLETNTSVLIVMSYWELRLGAMAATDLSKFDWTKKREIF